MENILSLDRQSILSAWTWAMVHSMWLGLVFAFLFYGFLHQFAAVSSKIKYSVGLSLFILFPIITALVFIGYLTKNSVPLGSINYTTNQLSLATTMVNINEGNQSGLFTSINQYADTLFLAWILGMLMLSTRMLFSYFQIQKLRNKTIPFGDASVLKIFDEIYQKSNLKIPIKIVSTTLLEMPSTIGHLKPIVLIPVSIINQLTYQETYAVIAHEVAHILRKDYLHNFIMSFIELLFFFHPSVWWFSSTLRSLREQCCDDIALKLGAEKMALSKALVQLEEHQSSPVLAMAFTHKHQLLNRIQRLFNPTMKNEFNISRSQAPILICSLALLLAFTKPVVNNYFKENKMALLNAFLWDEKPQVDTTKPKSKIEKITRDDGREKLELKLKDKKIEELKVNDKVISPADYSKYAEQTEKLQKELHEIEVPERKAGRARVYSDIDPLLDLVESYDLVAPPLHENKIITIPRNGGKSGARVYTLPRGQAPYIYNGNGDHSFGFGGKGHSGSRAWSFSGDDDIKWIIEGDSTNLTIDDDRVIIKNEKGDVIVDIGKNKDWSFGRNGILGNGNLFYAPHAFEGLEKLKSIPDDIKWRFEDKLRLQDFDELKLKGEFDEKILRELKENQAKINELMHQQHEKAAELREKMHFQNKELLEKQKEKAKGLKKMFDEAWGDAYRPWPGRANLSETLQNKLIEDGLVKKGEKYDFKYDNSGLKINGKKQNDETYNRYKKLLQTHTGINMNDQSMSFSFNGVAK